MSYGLSSLVVLQRKYNRLYLVLISHVDALQSSSEEKSEESDESESESDEDEDERLRLLEKNPDFPTNEVV